METDWTGGLSVIIPIKGRKDLSITVHSIFMQYIPRCEVIIVYNGVPSHEELDYSHIENPCGNRLSQYSIAEASKGAAINYGMGKAIYRIIGVVDADCVLKWPGLRILLSCFQRCDVAAAGGRIKVLKPHNTIEYFQSLEYSKAFNLSRPLFNMIKGDFLISGAFGLFRKDLLVQLGGYRTDTVGEDMDIVMRLHRFGYKFCYCRNAVCFSGAPKTLSRLIRQRNRWQRGLIDCLIHNRKMIFNPQYGVLGMVSLPYLLIFELLRSFKIMVGSIVLLIYAHVHHCVLFTLFVMQPLWFAGSLAINLIALNLDGAYDIGFLKALWLTVLSGPMQYILCIPRIRAAVRFRKERMLW